MKKLIRLFAIVGLSSSLFTAHAQLFGGPGSSAPDLSGAMKKLFGDNPNFTANSDIQMKGDSGEMSMPGKMSCSEGKSRFEMDMSEMKGGKMKGGGMAQMKQMGMDKMVMISIPDKKLCYLVYPGLEAYAEIANTNPDAAKSASDFDLKVTELGKETVEGHACVKNKVEITDKDAKKHEFTVWNATDLKKFPVKIEANENKTAMTILFKDVKFDKPEASQFEPPATYKKYDSMMAMMQQEMMKRMGNMQPPSAK